MKGKIKKIVGVLISATMLLTMTMGVFAAGSSTTGAGGVRVDGAKDVKISASSEQPSAAEIANLVGSNYSFMSSYDITGKITDPNKGATISFPVSGATSSSKIAVLHKIGSTWENLGGTAGTGVVNAVTKSFSPFAVVADTSTLSGTTKTSTSPKTGESSFVLTLGLLAMAAVAGVYGLNRKKAFSK